LIQSKNKLRAASIIGYDLSRALMMDEQSVRAVLSQVIDPEVGIDIVDLGLIYGVAVAGDAVDIRMTMTSPACPLGEHLVGEVERVLDERFPDAAISVELVWEPAWNPDRISLEGRKKLGWKPSDSVGRPS
jgi:metal-sulfur cluster biosynthetic enzyme